MAVEEGGDVDPSLRVDLVSLILIICRRRVVDFLVNVFTSSIDELVHSR